MKMIRAATRLFLAACLPAGASLVLSASPPRLFAALAAEQPSSAEIADALKPKPGRRTRALIGGDSGVEDRAFLDSLRRRSTRVISVEERTKAADIARAKPSVDLEVTFDYNSDAISAQATPTLVNLGMALRSGELQDRVFLISGHADASGEAAYNLALSQRRAEAVRRYLVERFGLKPENLIPIGFGQTQFKNAADPYAAENRRVQIVNTEMK